MGKTIRRKNPFEHEMFDLSDEEHFHMEMERQGHMNALRARNSRFTKQKKGLRQAQFKRLKEDEDF